MFILTQKSRKLIYFHREMFFTVVKDVNNKHCIMCHDTRNGYAHKIARNLRLYVANYLMTRILCQLNNDYNEFVDIDEELRGL